MSWLERLRRIEEKSEFLGDPTAKGAQSPSCSFCSPSPQEFEFSRGRFRSVDGGTDPVLVEWNEGVAQLSEMARPARIRPDDWPRIVADAARLLDGWGAQAAALGWTTLDIFGAHPMRPVERVDCAGLVLLLRGAEVVAVSNETIVTRNRSGARLTFRRRPLPDSVPLWGLR